MRIIGNGYQLWTVSDNDVIYDSHYVAYGLDEAKFLNKSWNAWFRSRVVKWLAKIKSVTSNR